MQGQRDGAAQSGDTHFSANRRANNESKNCLCLIAIFLFKHPVEQHTDASSDGGAILFQLVKGNRRIIAYFSKRDTAAESRYHSYELETLAIVNAVKHFRQYLQSKRFTVVTDCNSLKSSRKRLN